MAPVNILIDGVNKTFRPMAYIIVGFGTLIAILGIVLICLGNAGMTTLSLVGQTVSTSSVGVAAIGFGCIVAATAILRIIGIMGKAIDRILRRKDLFEKTDAETGSG